jgi:hypothetical protein
VIQQRVCETRDPIGFNGDNGVLVPPGRSQTACPDLQAIRHDVTVKVGIEVCPARVEPPALGMESSDPIHVRFHCLSIGQMRRDLIRVIGGGQPDLLIGPGVGTVPKPAAGPSRGQVPQVTLDEPTQSTRR